MPAPLTSDELGRFWASLASLLMRCAAAKPDLGQAKGLNLLLEGPGSELLDAPLTGTISMRRAIEVLCGEANVVETMKVLSALRDLDGVPEEKLASKLAELAATRARELATSASSEAAKPVPSPARISRS